MQSRFLALFAATVLCGGAAQVPRDTLLDDVRILSADAMAGRAAGSAGGAQARAYLIGRLKAIGVAPAYRGYEQPFDAKMRDGTGYTGANVIGRIKGTGKSDRVLVIGAHYDHLGTHDGQIFNGADDNASGVAVLLAIAEDFRRKPPSHDVIIALWDAEERGSPGAIAFLDAPPVPLARVVMNLNLDMLSRSDKNELWVAGASHYPFLRPRFETLAKRAPVALKIGHDAPPWKGADDWTNGSDHREFHKRGVPFAYFGVEDHPDYHKPTDDFDRIPLDFFKRSAATALAAARLFDRDLDVIAREAGRTK